MVGKREGWLSRGGDPEVAELSAPGRVGTEAWGGGSAVVRLSSGPPPLTLWGGGVHLLPAVGGEPVRASGGRAQAGCGAAGPEERPRAGLPVKWCGVSVGKQTSSAGWVERAPRLINPDEWCISCDGTFP